MDYSKFFTTLSLDQKDIQISDPRVLRSLLILMNQHAVNGGAACHWGGPAAIVEIISALYSIFYQGENWKEKFHLINDIGHAENAFYALRALYQEDEMTLEELRGFRSLNSRLTGHGESHVNPKQILLSNGPLGSSLAQALGLCLGDKLNGKNRTTISLVSDGASMEGEAKEAFASIPALASQGALNPYLMIISDNETKLSGRTRDAIDMKGTFQGLESLGWEVFLLENAHDISNVYLSLEKALEKALQNPQRPVCLWAKTVKGKGLQETEESPSGGHGYPLKAYDEKIFSLLEEVWQGDTPALYREWAQELVQKPQAATEKKPAAEKVQKGISKALINARKEGLPVVCVTSDLQGSTGVAPFLKEYPNFSYDIGVAEANMVSTAVGLSKSGFVTVCDTFSQFATTKGILPLFMGSLSQAPVIGIFSHTGFQDAADGASHQCSTYFATTCAIPNTKVICCSSSEEAEFFLSEALKRQYQEKKEHPMESQHYLFFIGRENFPPSWNVGPYQWQKPQVMTSGKDCLVVATGPMVPVALKASEELKNEGIHITVVNQIFINEIDVDFLEQELVKNHSNLITIEDHQITGGMGQQLTHKLSLQGVFPQKYHALGWQEHVGRSAYNATELYEKYGLGVRNLKENILKLVK